jgi:hypothetical protein
LLAAEGIGSLFGAAVVSAGAVGGEHAGDEQRVTAL